MELYLLLIQQSNHAINFPPNFNPNLPGKEPFLKSGEKSMMNKKKAFQNISANFLVSGLSIKILYSFQYAFHDNFSGNHVFLSKSLWSALSEKHMAISCLM
jgi:hypothetical protein